MQGSGLMRLSLMLVIVSLLSLPPIVGATGAVSYVTYVGGAAKTLEDEVVDLFRRKHPEIEVSFETLAAGSWALYEKLMVSRAAGVNIDMVLSHTNWLRNLIEGDVLLDLRPLIERDKIDTRLFPDSVIKSYTGPNGEIYAFPQQWTTFVLAYNRDYFQRYGMQEPSDTWDIFDMEKASRKLTISRDGDVVTGWGLSYEILNDYVWRLWGVPFVNVDYTRSGWDDPRAVEAWEWYASLYRPPVMIGGSAGWKRGDVAMRLTWPHYLVDQGKELTYEWDVRLHPLGAHGQRVTRAGGTQWVIFKDADNVEGAWRLLQFLISEEAQYAYAVRGRGGVQIPAITRFWIRDIDTVRQTFANPRALQNPQAIVDSYADALLDRQPVNWHDLLQEVVFPMAKQLERGEVPAKTAVPEAVRRINAALSALRSR
jgi:ABC-type glycerol-3-phosphate transport system substrate-binding protein